MLVEASELGNVDAMEKVAFAYFFGNDLSQNITAAKIMFEKLSMLGNPRGQLVRFISGFLGNIFYFNLNWRLLIYDRHHEC